MGLDEILEIEKRISLNSCRSVSGSAAAVLSRALLQFDIAEISNAIAEGKITNPCFFLTLKTCDVTEVPVKYTIAAYPLSKPWNMGTGYKYDGSTVTDGVSWKFTDGISNFWYSGSITDCSGGGTWWVSASLEGSGSGYVAPPFISPDPYNPFPECPNSGSPAPTSSYIAPVTGGFVCYQTFDYQTSDIRMDITTIMNAWLSNTIDNNGIILMHSDETSSIDYGSLKFFSKETNTIYYPYIDVAWDDSVYITGSQDEVRIRDAVVNIKNMAKEYKQGSIIRFDVTPRKRYPIKTFTNKFSEYTQYPYRLPESSYYQIKDAESEEVILSYDSYTKLSLDEYGNFFTLDTNGLPQERYFKVEIRTEQSGSILTFPIPTTFKISR